MASFSSSKMPSMPPSGPRTVNMIATPVRKPLVSDSLDCRARFRSVEEEFTPTLAGAEVRRRATANDDADNATGDDDALDARVAVRLVVGDHETLPLAFSIVQLSHI